MSRFYLILVSANDGKGAKIQGQTSGVTGVVKGYLLPPEEGVEQITVFLSIEMAHLMVSL